MDAISISMAEKRRSSRVAPVGSREDVVVLHLAGAPRLAKILDLSDGGVCVYLIEPDAPLQAGDRFHLSLYHQEQICEIEVEVCRRSGQVAGLEFVDLSPEAARHVRAKIIRLEVEWTRVKDSL